MTVTPLGVTDLHLHLEGSLSIKSAIEIAAVRGHEWGSLTPAQLRRKFRYANFMEFLWAVRSMAQVLSAPEVLERAAYELSRFSFEHGVRYAEVYFSPYIYVRWGLNYGEVLRAVESGFDRGEAEGFARCGILLDSVRQWGAEAAAIVLESYAESGASRVVGFGLGGEELVPLENFVPVYDRARALGLHTLVHAGEVNGSADIWKAIDVLGVDRIAHGIRAVDDDALLRELAKRKVPLDVAISSNYRTRVVVSRPHPIRRLLDAGIFVTLNSDDPSLFRCDLPREYVRARRFGEVTAGELFAIARNGVEASFADDVVKQECRRIIAERERS